MMGLVVTLHYLGKIELGTHRIETPVGVVKVELVDSNTVSIENVASYCYQQNVAVDVDGLGAISGDIAWGGNWFFLIDGAPIALRRDNVVELTIAATAVKQALRTQGITGKDGADIDHIEFFDAADTEDANSRNFVLCPGNAYDRSPCGTGTSAKLACLASKGKLGPGEPWIQESVIGSTFTASYRLDDEQQVIPTISSSAFICGEGTLIRQANDPFIDGIQ
jgi:4-hydroxyproline epimerase